jgi:3-deoxy-D-manno-octulosonic-acid transferase
MLSRFDHLFVQNKSSKELIDQLGLAHICSISGDTRFDRVKAIASKASSIPLINSFIGNHKTMIAGSTWPEDEEVLQKAFDQLNDPSLKLIIAPHEINEKHLRSIRELFPSAVFYSELTDQDRSPSLNTSQYLVIDNVGMLSRLYQYAHIAYIGGGLRTMGVHNVLEAAVFSKPVVFGPYYEKYTEAKGLVDSGGASYFTDESKDGKALKELIAKLLSDSERYNRQARAAGDFVRSHTGATDKIIQFIQEKRLLTS